MMFVIVFIFGLVVGSFLNVVIWRLRAKESILVGRSHCPRCRHILGPAELVPLASFIFQKGRCRHCKQKISWQYPLVELVTAILFLIAYLPYDLRFTDYNFFLLGRTWFVIAVMIVIFVYDLKYYLILDKIIYPAAIVVLLTIPFVPAAWNWRGVADALFAAAIGGGFFFLQYLISHGKWIGGGDVKMGALMGLILGVAGLLVALFFAYVIGAIFGLILVAVKKKTMKSQIPFGTFLAVGTMISLFWVEPILKWYLNY